jgi:hypothetical protein
VSTLLRKERLEHVQDQDGEEKLVRPAVFCRGHLLSGRGKSLSVQVLGMGEVLLDVYPRLDHSHTQHRGGEVEGRAGTCVGVHQGYVLHEPDGGFMVSWYEDVIVEEEWYAVVVDVLVRDKGGGGRGVSYEARLHTPGVGDGASPTRRRRSLMSSLLPLQHVLTCYGCLVSPRQRKVILVARTCLSRPDAV